MTEKEREQVALFRYGLIAPLLNEQVHVKTYLQQMEEKLHDMPYYGERHIAAKTIQEWHLNYRRGGYEALKPKKRADRGQSRRLSVEDQQHILALRREVLYMPVTVFYEELVKRGEIQVHEVSYATINRLLKKHQLTGQSYVSAAERKRFAHEEVNVLWQTIYRMALTLGDQGRSRKRF